MCYHDAMVDHHYELIASRITASKRKLALQTAVLFLIPIILIQLYIIPLGVHTMFLIGIGILLTGVLIKEKWTFEMLGMTNSFKKHYILAYCIFTVVGVVVISQMGELSGRNGLSQWWQYRHFLYLFFVVSLFQELAYRSYLIPVLGKLTASPAVVIFSNAVFFTFLHIIYPNFLFNLPLAFVGGIGFAYMYIRFPSLPLIVISHAILNFVAVLYGFFIVPGITY